MVQTHVEGTQSLITLWRNAICVEIVQEVITLVDTVYVFSSYTKGRPFCIPIMKGFYRSIEDALNG